MRYFFFLLLVLPVLLSAQSLSVTTFGDSEDPAIIYLHGGPGYNSVGFERATADSLAHRGFFVISYDRRGEGRSEEVTAAFTFDESFADLLSLYDRHDLEQATLLGHSFGGVLALKFAERYPQRTTAVVLVSAPLSMQRTLSDILAKSRTIYEQQKDTVNLGYLDQIAVMDTASLPYSNYAFAHAMQNDFYRTPNPTAAAQAIYAGLATDSLMQQYGSRMSAFPPMGFWKNEQYTSIDLAPVVARLTVPVFGIYGKDDGLFSAEAVREIAARLGEEHLLYLEQASHSVFIDRRSEFLDTVAKWLRQTQ